MAIPNPLLGTYTGVESLRMAANILDTSRDALILDHLDAASRAVEQDTDRFFFPYQTTAYLRWPQLSPQSTWMLWSPDDLLSVTTLQAAASGQNASPVGLTHYYLEPNDLGPPYTRVEVDLSYGDVFTTGNTPQRAIALAGQFGYSNNLVPAGTLTDAAGINASVTTITCSDWTRIDQGDLLLCDSEQVYVTARGVSPSTLTVQRGANGTTAAAHLLAASIRKYQAPADIRRLVRADALSTLAADQAQWWRSIGADQQQVDWSDKALRSMRTAVIQRYYRARSAVI